MKMTQLSPKQMKSSIKSALMGAMSILKTQTTRNFRQLFKTKVNPKTHKKYLAGIKKTWDKKEEAAKVHIMGDYVLRFFEDGTKQRKTRKGYNRGRITARHYFRDARTATEAKVMNDLEKRIAYQIYKKTE